jgi:DNA-directed RNA polymerase subunit RPC12/RpoP
MIIQCPECSKQVSDQAYTCPNCGFSIKKKREKPSPGCFMKTLNAGCLNFYYIIIGIILFGVILNAISMYKNKATKKEAVKIEKTNGK